MLDKDLPEFPAFDNLTLDPKGPKGNAWGLFGPNNDLEMLNILMTDTLKAAAKEIIEGTRFSLDWRLDQPAKPSFGRQPFKHKITTKTPKIVNGDIVEFNTQCSNQWDGLNIMVGS
jgi:hypothetical protein